MKICNRFNLIDIKLSFNTIQVGLDLLIWGDL